MRFPPSRTAATILQNNAKKYSTRPKLIPRIGLTADAIPLLEAAMGITKPEQWYSVVLKDVKLAIQKINNKMETETPSPTSLFASSTITQEKLRELLKEHHSSFNWNPFLFKQLGVAAFADRTYRKRFLQAIEEELGIKQPEDWYHFTLQAAIDAANRKGIQNHFHSLLTYRYSDRLMSCLEDLYPEVKWDAKKFKYVPKHFFTSLENQRTLMDDIGKQLGIKTYTDWYSFGRADIEAAAEVIQMRKNFESVLDSYHKSSVPTMLKKIYSEHPWDDLKFKMSPRGVLSSQATQKVVLEKIASILQLQESADWYTVTAEQMKQAATALDLRKALATMISRHKGSHIDMIISAYPELDKSNFEVQRKKMPATTDTNANSKLASELIKLVEQKLYIQNPMDWYRVTASQLVSVKGLHLIRKLGGLPNLLRQSYPNIQWDEKLLSSKSGVIKRGQQRVLFSIVRKILGEEVTIQENYNSPYTFGETGENVEFDIFVPTYNLALEYHGHHHYNDVNVFGSLREYQHKDEERRKLCKQHGITLIEVPYTWKITLEGVAATIHGCRPDIPLRLTARESSKMKTAAPIPSSTPSS